MHAHTHTHAETQFGAIEVLTPRDISHDGQILISELVKIIVRIKTKETFRCCEVMVMLVHVTVVYPLHHFCSTYSTPDRAFVSLACF